MDAPLVAQYACQALDSLLSKHDGNQQWFGEHGLGEGLVRCMSLHQHASPPVVLEYALWALYNLCVDCSANQVSEKLTGKIWLGQTNTWLAPTVIFKYLTGTYNHLIDSLSHKTKVGLSGGCEQLVKSLHIHRHHGGLMAQVNNDLTALYYHSTDTHSFDWAIIWLGDTNIYCNHGYWFDGGMIRVFAW